MDHQAGSGSWEDVKKRAVEHYQSHMVHPAALQAAHMADARLFATRNDLIAAVAPRPATRVAEVGVALGEFSDFLIRELRPKTFVGFDTFDMHRYPAHWGRSSEEIFGGLTHAQYYRRRLESIGVEELVVEEGLSTATLPKYPREYFDLIYIDAGHTYDDVKGDIRCAVPLLKPDGLIVFNDYTMFDPFIGEVYGVVPAVHELVLGGGWKVVGLGLQRHMFCDIAVRRG